MFLRIFLAFLTGVITWSFLEYALHRFVGHGMKGKNKFSREHLAHHAVTSYFTPTGLKIINALLILSASFFALLLIMDWKSGLAYILGIATFYTYYEFLHRRIHTHPPKDKVGNFIYAHHLFHHYGNTRKNHGVTSPLWDIVFKTYVKPEKIRVPSRNMPDWLKDSSTNLLKDEYLNLYELLHSKNLV